VSPLPPSLQILHTTLMSWSEGWSDETVEDHPLLAALREKGKILYEDGGTFIKKTLKYRRTRLAGYRDLQRQQWTRHEKTKVLELPWRGLNANEMYSDLELRQNRGRAARVKLFANKLGDMKEELEEDFGRIFYQDGEATGFTDHPHGIQSFMSHTGAVATDAFATTLNDTYGGLSTARGAYGGTVKGGGAPSGTNFESSDPEWDFLSPVLVNALYNDGSAALSWATDACSILGRAITHAQRGKGRKHQLDVFTMDAENYNALKDQQRSKERITVNPGSDRSLMVSLGFKNIMMVDGVDVMIDRDTPATTGGSTSVALRAYGWNFGAMALHLLPDEGKKQFWNRTHDYFEPDDGSYRFIVGLWGNFKFRPRYFVEVADYA